MGEQAPLPRDFLELSADCGSDPLRVQGPGGNTSIKLGETLWIKASGTELANALDQDIFVAVDRVIALSEAKGAGDGTCQAAILDPERGLRPSIETTFHALIDWPVVAHTHSVATLVHATSDQGLDAAREKLNGLPAAFVPYRKPGRPLTEAIAAEMTPNVQVFVLGNHGLIVAGDSAPDVATLMCEVEIRLAVPIVTDGATPQSDAPDGFVWLNTSAVAQDKRLFSLATTGSYYPDHVVFLGPALPTKPVDGAPACLIEGQGLAIRADATSAQRAMAQCLSDVLTRLPPSWTPNAIGSEAEAELLNWDAENYRQALAARKS
ncbi:MAG: class II aldolase [Rhizobiales bacterium]|nr:class II aldolase [Hyphomicrobiales bacterium]MBO6697550.1 class II aldolase [Hyphomicrobiales bacterium]MBO6736195.1 class II aldolase [Hyphomicrobiales bacterium]MBO6912665.1 class II aldolase [Hyphomicrobiales bacterium]MBO6956398.1 class II aldolase [Hyphomicrobiales bacterium]